MTRPGGTTRRSVLGAAAALPWAGCERADAPRYDGAWLGAAFERGHRLRETRPAAPAASHSGRAATAASAGRRADVIVVGAGIAGLAAARALTRSGITDVHVFELEDAAGGNSRGHVMGGMACPLGAHYLPLPGEQTVEVAEWLDEIGLRRLHNGTAVFDERLLCHAPQERLFVAGQWVDGLLPPIEALPPGQRAETQAQYLRFHRAVDAAGRAQAFSMPTARSQMTAATLALDRVTFSAWLDSEGLTAPALRWYLDYCCRDDYGAGARFVSAWAGLHYFASRHGFQAPGLDASEREGVLTWAQGNAWLVDRLAAGLGDRIHLGQTALRVHEGRHEVQVEFWNAATQATQTWTAGQVVLAIPLFVAAHLLAAPPGALEAAVAVLHHAPWLVANVQLMAPLVDRGGAAPAWDNVMMDRPTLGYVDAMHQSMRPFAGPTVLTAYWALGGNSATELRQQRARLLSEPWSVWAGSVVQELAHAHPDIHTRIARIDLMRYGHAMAIPSPGVRSHASLQALSSLSSRVQFAHSDLSGYSVFEEAFFQGHRAGTAVARTRLGAGARRAT
jgi:monoamine oxidase